MLLFCCSSYGIAQDSPIKITKLDNFSIQAEAEDAFFKLYNGYTAGIIETSISWTKDNADQEEILLRFYLLADVGGIKLADVGDIKQANIILSNGEKLYFECHPAGAVDAPSASYFYEYNYDGDKILTLTFNPYPGPFANQRGGYTSTFRSDNEFRTHLKTKYLFNQLALYDIVEIRLNEHSLQPLFKSSAVMRSIIKELRAQRPSSYLLPDLNNLDRSWANKPTTSKPATPVQKSTVSTPSATKPTNSGNVKHSATTKSNANKSAKADRRAENLSSYSKHIARKDYIAPSELMYSPLALFTSRAIPMEVLVAIINDTKGISKVNVDSSTDGKLKSVTVHPTEFYCRLRGFEEVPCALMSVDYDATNTKQIKTATFTYNLPESWMRAKVKQYAKSLSDDMYRMGMQWREEKERYIGFHQGNYIMITYGSKGDNNFIYIYIRYAE